MRLKGIIGTIALIFTVLGCKEPVKDYSYMNLNRLHGWKGDTGITLEFDITDTLVPYEIYIVGEIVAKRSLENRGSYPVNILLTAPDSTVYTDTIKLPLHIKENGSNTKRHHGIREIEWPYRKNIYNTKPGRWSVTFTKGDTLEDYSNIIGLGIHCKQQTQ